MFREKGVDLGHETWRPLASGQLHAHFSGISDLEAERCPTLPLFRLGKLAPISLNACMLRIEASYPIKIDYRMDLHIGISDTWLSPQP